MIPESDEGDLAKQPAVRQLAKNSNLLEYSCPLSRHIHDNQFYLNLVSLSLRLAHEAGVPAKTFEVFAYRLLLHKGLQRDTLLTACNDTICDSGNNYNILERGCSLKDQLALVAKMEGEVVEARQREAHLKACRTYIAAKITSVAPSLYPQDCSKKSRFKGCLARKAIREGDPNCGTKTMPSCYNDYVFKYPAQTVLKNLFIARNECYNTLRSFVKLKTMFGHASEADMYMPSPIFNTIFDKNEYLVITGGEEGNIKVWSRRTGQLINTLKAADGVRFFNLHTMYPLGGWLCDSIIDIASIIKDGQTIILFCDTNYLHLLSEKVMLLRSSKSQILKNSDFISYSFRKFIKADNTKVNVIVPSPDAEYILLGFENGQIILTKSAMLNCSLLDVTNHNLNLNSTTIINPSMINPSLINPSLINQPITYYNYLPCLRVWNAHWKEIIEVKWVRGNEYFITGGHEGCCVLWEFKNEYYPKRIEIIEGNKCTEKRRKKKYACNFVVLNCTHSHFAAGFHELTDDYDIRGNGYVIIYNFSYRCISCYFSRYIDLKLQSIKAMDAHPFYPNIILICYAGSKIILFDIFLKCIVNIFEYRGYHLLHPQYCLSMGDCRFANDGMTFVVSSDMGSVSLYGYDIKKFYELCPDYQFLQNDFQQFEVDHETMRLIPLLYLPQPPTNNICNIRGDPYQYCPKIDAKYWLNRNEYYLIEHCNEIEANGYYLNRIYQNIHYNYKMSQFYSKTYYYLYNNKQQILSKYSYYQSVRLISILQTQYDKLQGKHKSLTNKYIQDDISQSYLHNPYHPQRKLLRMTYHTRNASRLRNYAYYFDYNSSKYEDFDANGKDNYDEHEDIDEYFDDNYSDSMPRVRRHNLRTRRQTIRDISDSVRSSYYDNRRSSRRRKYLTKSIPYDVYAMLYDEQYRNDDIDIITKRSRYAHFEYPPQYTKRRKRNNDYINHRYFYRRNSQYSAYPITITITRNQRIHSRIYSSNSEDNLCIRCNEYPAIKKCVNCPYNQYFCQQCSIFRGQYTNEYLYRCFICLLLDNYRRQCFDNLDYEAYRLVTRDTLYVPQIGDRLRMFFQGYYQFLAEHACKLNSKVVEDIEGFRLLPHTYDSRLLYTPLCKVTNILYYFPLYPDYYIYSKRGHCNSYKNRIYMLLTLYLCTPTGEAENPPYTFWLYFLPGYSYLLREYYYMQLQYNNTLKKISEEVIVHIDDEDMQVLYCSPLYPIFPNSLWQCLKVRKMYGKRLRGHTKYLDKRVNLWQVTSIIIRVYQSAIPTEQTQFIANNIEDLIIENYDYCMFQYYVDFDIYSCYRDIVEVGMCLYTICKRLRNCYYSNYDSLKYEVNILYSNSIKFNTEYHEVTKLAHNLVERINQIILAAKYPSAVLREKPTIQPEKYTISNINHYQHNKQTIEYPSTPYFTRRMDNKRNKNIFRKKYNEEDMSYYNISRQSQQSDSDCRIRMRTRRSGQVINNGPHELEDGIKTRSKRG